MDTPDMTPTKWRKSSYSGDTGGQCVELAAQSRVVAVRDSKNQDQPALVFPRAAFGALLHTL
ncbi:DUF397 domain-containing protein [Actinocorallia sp. API 0066]|uniref:DUF397 domain-containing protein n=1 Tax=Actinocorallia sp. API 0066 TaxID=2896846 RepID=UPI001E3450FC|nr:DUF397 domain-containing protein [Actinocorallia sp. API 0066]MCD0448138.1 DUF397 domain-containing protein [Actinocorallia sp. API 0066]